MARINRKRIVLVVLLVAVVAVTTYWVVNELGGRDRVLEATGTLEAVEVDVGALVTGRVVALHYDEGDDVSAGDVVAALDAEELTAGVAAAEAAARAAADRVAAAGAAYAASDDQFKRVARAYPAGITKAEYERARAARDGASAELASARSLAAQAEATKAQLDARRREVEVRAPITGVVLSRNVEPGEVLGAGTPVVTLADLSVLELNVFIPEAKVGFVGVGDPVEIAVDSYPGDIFRGKVKAIGSKAEFTPRNVESKEDRVTLVFKVTVTVPNGDGKLKPGMPADVSFVEAPSPN
ncbi:MAG TPA: efflux RND transporter periplasmic adaptor subunit [bacterium]|nr:efflux RND transporter periplasmic adaptor subunit [bacterium]